MYTSHRLTAWLGVALLALLPTAQAAVGARVLLQETNGNSLYRVNYALSGDGWDGHTVVPQPSAERNYIVHGAISGAATVDAAVAAKKALQSPGGPVINPQASKQAKGSPTTLLTAPSPPTRSTNKADAVSLNPQPLPPSALTPAQVPSALR